MACVGHTKAFKVGLAWATDEQLWVISNLVLIKNNYTTKELKPF